MGGGVGFFGVTRMMLYGTTAAKASAEKKIKKVRMYVKERFVLSLGEQHARTDEEPKPKPREPLCVSMRHVVSDVLKKSPRRRCPRPETSNNHHRRGRAKKKKTPHHLSKQKKPRRSKARRKSITFQNKKEQDEAKRSENQSTHQQAHAPSLPPSLPGRGYSSRTLVPLPQPR